MNNVYWEKWKKKEYVGRRWPVSWVDADKLKDEATRVGMRNTVWVKDV